MGKVRVTWSRPTLGPGQVITGYSVQYRRSGTTSYTTRSVSGSSTTSYTITNLNLGTVYEVRVASVGPLGLSGYCCGSGKQVMTYNCEYNALNPLISNITHDSAQFYTCSANWLSVDTCVGHCLLFLCMPEPFLWNLGSLLNAGHGDRALGSFCVCKT